MRFDRDDKLLLGGYLLSHVRDGRRPIDRYRILVLDFVSVS